MRAGHPERVYLIAANDGQLLKYWRDFGAAHPDSANLVATLRRMLQEERETDPDGAPALRLINLSRQPHHALFEQLLDAVVEHQGWSSCEGCELLAESSCPIRRNRDILRARGDRSPRLRLGEVIRLAAANDMHLPMRQVLVLIVNMLLGDKVGQRLLTCRTARQRTSEAACDATNALGINLRPKDRGQYHVFTALEAFGLLERTHAIGDWVVTYDAIADRRLFEENDIHIIRHLTKPDGKHNLIVSTRMPGRNLRQQLHDEVAGITGDPATRVEAIVGRALQDAARVSGRVVLRAARLGTNALELLGLVLARRLIADSLPASIRPFGWLLLDDFGNWLGHRGGEVADLLALALHDGDGELTAELFVVESKFVGEAACSEEARKSRRQLERTMDGLIHRLFNGENPRSCQEDQAEGHEEVRPVLPTSWN